MDDFGPKPRLRSLLDHFSTVDDPREAWRIAHPLPEVLLLIVCASIASCDDFDDIAAWAEERRLLFNVRRDCANLAEFGGWRAGNGKVFTSLQDYLDGSVLINGAYCRRRTVLLAIHDLKDEREAPPALQSKTLSKLELLHLRPVPQVIFYDDIATAILRMEVLIRLEAMRKRLCDLLRRSAFLKKGLRSGACTPFQVKRHDEAMTSDVENLMLEHLRAIRAGISEIKLKVDELPREPCRLAEECRLSR